MFSFAESERLHMTRGRFLDECDSVELTRYMAWEKVRPPTAEEHRHAGLCFLICRLAGNKAAKYDDFLPSRGGGRRKRSPAEVRASFAAAGAMVKASGTPKDGPKAGPGEAMPCSAVSDSTPAPSVAISPP
jgi:hypothetical protein